VTAARLREQGIARLVDVRAIELPALRALVGSQAEWLHQLALGIDERAVEPNRPHKSAGHENTYDRDLTDVASIRAEIERMGREVAGWLGRREIVARTVTIKVRYDNFETITRSVTEAPPTRDPDTVAARAVRLLEKTDAGVRPVRLLGVSVHNLIDGSAPEPPDEPTDALPLFPS
jgi:nucleotidyltransferase/DNA polymerase involved in DNA repair